MMATLTGYGDAILADIIAHPKDDTPRLVYADLLDENGETARAEFIRGHLRDPSPVSWNAEHLRLAPDSPQKTLMLALAQMGFSEGSWDRGFVNFVAGPLQAWLDHGPALVRWLPIDRVRVTNRDARVTTGWIRNDPDAPLSAGPALIPLAVWDLLPDAEAKPCTGWAELILWRKGYATPQDAVDALSVALILWAKSQP